MAREWARRGARFRRVVCAADVDDDDDGGPLARGREFHTKHNLHIETQTQWPRQVGRGAVLPARARVRGLYPRV